MNLNKNVLKQGILDSGCDWVNNETVKIDPELLPAAIVYSGDVYKRNHIGDIYYYRKLYHAGINISKRVQFMLNNTDGVYVVISKDELINKILEMNKELWHEENKTFKDF